MSGRRSDKRFSNTMSLLVTILVVAHCASLHQLARQCRDRLFRAKGKAELGGDRCHATGVNHGI